MVFQHKLIHRIGVVAPKPVSPVVHGVAILRLAGFGLDQALIRANAEIAAADVDRLPGLEGADGAAAVAVGAVDPVVQAPEQPIGAVLLVSFAKAAVEVFTIIAMSVALGVLGIEDVRRIGNE